MGTQSHMSQGVETKADRVRGLLIDAGTRLIAELGIEGVNTNSLAREARVGVGTFYNHFDDKHALHRAVVMRGFEQLQAELAAASARLQDADIEDQVRGQVAATADFAAARKLALSRWGGAKNRKLDARALLLDGSGASDAAAVADLVKHRDNRSIYLAE